MKRRRGQIAVYLVAVIVAIAVLMIMNVSIFLSVRTKNLSTNAGDAAALAVAKYQGELLNKIGADNIEHLRAAIRDDAALCDEIMLRQKRMCFLDPLEGIRIGDRVAREMGIQHGSEDQQRILRRHVMEIRQVFAADNELYPEPWDGAWTEYADALEALVGTFGDGLVAGPDNIRFANAWKHFPLLHKDFYDAIAARNWCWFHFNGEWLFDRDSHTMPRPDFAEPKPICNSEIYSLNLEFRPLPAVLGREWMAVIIHLTGCTEDDIEKSSLLKDPSQVWAFYDETWRHWSEIDPYGEWRFPVVGSVKPEYDVLGCAAACRVISDFTDLVEESQKTVHWTAAAKPFGTVRSLDGEVSVVTAFNGLVTPAFEDARLVPFGSIEGNMLSTADPQWMDHVTEHLPEYFRTGPHVNGCFYCAQLKNWEMPAFRRTGKTWLKFHASDCVRPAHGSGGAGGHVYGH